MQYIANAFSLQMVNNIIPCSINIEPCTKEEALDPQNTSVVGHPDTANVLGVACNRVSISLTKGDTLYVAQVVGGRLPEGATTLPEGFKLKFIKVTIK